MSNQYTFDLSPREPSIVAHIQSLVQLCNLKVKLPISFLFSMILCDLFLDLSHDLDLALKKLG